MSDLVAAFGRLLSRIGRAFTRAGYALQVWAWRPRPGGSFRYTYTAVTPCPDTVASAFALGAPAAEDISAGTLLAYRPDGTAGPAEATREVRESVAEERPTPFYGVEIYFGPSRGKRRIYRTRDVVPSTRLDKETP